MRHFWLLMMVIPPLLSLADTGIKSADISVDSTIKESNNDYVEILKEDITIENYPELYVLDNDNPAIGFCFYNGWGFSDEIVGDNKITSAQCTIAKDIEIEMKDLYLNRNGKYKETIEKYARTETFDKPVIYLYPTQATDINVQLDYKGKLIVVYPPLPKEGWSVTAEPDGTLINHADNQEYSYLFWEGISDVKFSIDRGFVVKGVDTAIFLQEKLSYLGLTPKEYNEFIVFWLPKMQDNPYNLITFQGKEYTDSAPLTITPQPDSMLRVFMVYKPLKEFRVIEEQILEPFTRTGFSVIEWGGSEY